MSITKKIFVGAFIGAFAFAFSTANAAYMHSVTLKQGSTGSQVMSLQQTLNMTSCKVAVSGVGSAGMETMYFGGLTKAAVLCFQAANGLGVDGVVGPMTGAKLGLVVAGPAGNPNQPGCPAGANFNSITGAPCTGNPGNGGLDGSEGTISDVTELSSYNNEEVGEGQEDVKVLGMDVEASNDGDIRIKSIKVSFDSTGNSGSDNFDDYFDSVSVWMGDEEVGSADADEFSENGNVFSRIISIDSSAVIDADETEKFYVSVSAVENLDSGDISGDSWTVDVDSIRFVDGSGVVSTDTSTGDIDAMDVPIAFVSFSAAADTELKVSSESDSPEAGIVLVDDNGDITEDVVLLKGKLKLEGTSDVVLDEFPVTFTTTGTASVVAAASNVKFVIDGEEYSESVSFAGQTGTVVFDDLDFTVEAGDTVEFEVLADINDIDGSTLVSGDTIKASVTSTNRGHFDAENEEGDQLDDSTEKSGTAIGDAQELRANGIALTLVSTDKVATVGSGNNDDSGTFTIKFKVTAVGDDVYLGTTVTQGFTYAVDSSGTATTVFLSAVVVNDTDTDVTSQGNYLIEDGENETFTLTVVRNAAAAGLFRASLTGVKWDTSDADTTMANTYSSNLDSFKTGYLNLN
jgi:peptidoglycan hydrolase-like protein with peptidoglycan-binding domain